MVQSIVQKRVQCLLDGGLKLLALDFDLTICSIHTRGVYMGTEEDLNSLLHPDMVQLIQAASPRLQVAVTTFSRQTQLISNLMKRISPKDKIIVRGDFSCETVNKAIINEGKQTHLHSVLDEVHEECGERYRPDQILLVDDQGDNVRTAVHNGSYGLIFHGPNCLSALDRPVPSSPSLLSCKCHEIE